MTLGVNDGKTLFMVDLIFQDWGLIDFDESLKKQLALVEEVHSKNLPGYLIFCSHKPVVTKGRSTKPEDIFAWQGAVTEASRGGRATYHGPSQLNIYPVINLNFVRKGRPAQDINNYLRAFEEAIVIALAQENIIAQRRSGTEETGIWVQNRKIASVGIAIKSWIAFHGAAINIFEDAQAFQGINPCGFPSEIMISLEHLQKNKPQLDQFKSRLQRLLLAAL